MEKIDQADGTYGTVSTVFDYSGFTTTITDPDNKQKTEKRDHLGRIIQVTEYAEEGPYDTHYTYNAAGDLLTVTDHLGNLTTITPDTLGRKVNMTDPDMGFWQYTYDKNGNLITRTDNKTPPQIITFDYDAINRIVSKTILWPMCSFPEALTPVAIATFFLFFIASIKWLKSLWL